MELEIYISSDIVGNSRLNKTVHPVNYIEAKS